MPVRRAAASSRMSADESRVLLERRARAYRLKPVRSAGEPTTWTRSAAEPKGQKHAMSRLEATLASSRDHVLSQTRCDPAFSQNPS